MKARPKNDYKQTIKSVSDILIFGKYKHHTIEEVINLDPGYILWMHDEKVARISKEIVDIADEAEIDQRFSEAFDGDFRGMSMWDYLGDDE